MSNDTAALARLLLEAFRETQSFWVQPPPGKVAEYLLARGVTVGEARQIAAMRKALLSVSVHSAHLPGAPRELLVELLAKCGVIARDALAADAAVTVQPSAEGRSEPNAAAVRVALHAILNTASTLAHWDMDNLDVWVRQILVAVDAAPTRDT